MFIGIKCYFCPWGNHSLQEREHTQKRDLAIYEVKTPIRKLNKGDPSFVSRWHSDFKHASKDISSGAGGKCHLLKFIFGTEEVDNYNTCQNKISNLKEVLIAYIFLLNVILNWCY